MKIEGGSIRPGNVIEHKGRLWIVTKAQSVKPGKGGAFNQVELKDLRDGTKLNERFRSEDTVERAYLDERTYQFLYVEDDNVHVMDQETFDQVAVPRDLFGPSAAFLQDGMTVTLELYEGEPVRAALPDSVVLEVSDAEPVVKGQTATSSYKPATLDNGVRTMVPPHIEPGTKVVISTADGSYLERAKG